MLNETWQLLRALEKSNIACAPKHKRIQIPGRASPCIKVYLNKDGQVIDVNDVNASDWPNWTIMEGNQNSFPVIAVQEPLCPLPQEDENWLRLGFNSEGRRPKQQAQKNNSEAIKQVLANCGRQYSRKTQDLWRRLKAKAEELADCTKNAEHLQAVFSVANSFKGKVSAEDFIGQVVEKAIAKYEQGTFNNIDAIEQLLVGKEPPNGGRRIPFKIQLALDAQDQSVYRAGLLSRLIEVLPGETASSKNERIDAFTRELADTEMKNLPKANLPFAFSEKNRRFIRKPLPLMSMFSAAPCNSRYGMTDAEIFPMAKTRALRLKEALEEITADSRNEKTWRLVASGEFESSASSGKIEKQDLLVVYAEDRPEIEIKLSRLFGAGADVVEDRFEVDSAVICKALEGMVSEQPQSRLNLFIIREVSRGQRQVILAQSPSVKAVLKAAELWQQGAQNIPPTTLSLQKSDAKPEVKDAFPLTPYPERVVRLLSYQWIRDGSAEQAIVGPGLGKVIALLLRREGDYKSVARQFLDLALQRISPLLIGLFGTKHAYGPRRERKRPEPLDNYLRDSRETALQAIAVLGILLDTLNSKKEKYMKEAPYQVGQVLSLADTLHKDYCIVVRKGEMPNSIIGTVLMRRALDNPIGALADLAERMLEYIRWAKIAQVSGGQSDDERIATLEARKKLRQYQTLAAALGKSELPQECNNIRKAQLLLGFLANQPEEENIYEEED